MPAAGMAKWTGEGQRKTVLEIFQPLLSLLAAHPYLFIFVGMLVAGEVILLPAIYLAATGRLEIGLVIALAVTATLLSDIVWYLAGRRFPASALARIPGRRARRVVDGLEKLFTARGPHILFLSKFVYGTRTAAQVLAGVHDMPFRKYMAVNVLGVLAVTGTLVAVAYSIVGTTRRFSDTMRDMEVAFLLFVLVAVLGYLVVGQRMRRQWFL
jgi:membrane protein DedA with SNARE-associated domain